ncbi:hypothetical protein H6G27_18395 [Nostoc linckia FACHB-104]|nr:hypothetical protein [Nostoc linckia FACHB-104]
MVCSNHYQEYANILLLGGAIAQVTGTNPKTVKDWGKDKSVSRLIHEFQQINIVNMGFESNNVVTFNRKKRKMIKTNDLSL